MNEKYYDCIIDSRNVFKVLETEEQVKSFIKYWTSCCRVKPEEITIQYCEKSEKFAKDYL